MNLWSVELVDWSLISWIGWLIKFSGMTSPAPPNTRQVRLAQIHLFTDFERVAFKSWYSINKLLHCKAKTNMQYQKFHQVRIIQDTNCHWFSLCLFVSFVLEALLLFLALLLFHSEHTANPVWHTSANPFSLCRVTTPRPPCWEKVSIWNKGTKELKIIRSISPKWYQDACLGVSRWSEKQKNVVSIQ